jgi:hypothetical protein
MPRGIPNKPAGLGLMKNEVVIGPGPIDHGFDKHELDPGFKHDVSHTNVVDLDAIRAELAAELAKAKELTTKLEQRAEIRSEVNEQLKAQQEETRRREFARMAPQVAPVMPAKPDEKLITVKLDRNWAPDCYYEVAGYTKEAVKRKNVAGMMVVIEPEEFIVGEKKPPAIAGTGFANKIWAGTVLRIPEPVARDMRKYGILSIELD